MSYKSFLKDIPIHQDILSKALKLIFTPKNAPTRFSNMMKHKKGNQTTYYLNTSAVMVHSEIQNNDPIVIDGSRIKNYRVLHYGNTNSNVQSFTLDQL